MGTHMNFQSLGYEQLPLPEDGNGSLNPAENLPLARQSSIYSLTFDEFQNSYSGVGKDFGSMNMDELLKNIWTAEETHNMAPYPAGGSAASAAGGSNLQRQGSLALPRMLSLKTVEEVYKDMLRGSTGGNNDGSVSNMPDRQLTLGEMTLEDFLARAGVVREDDQQFGVPNNDRFFGEMSEADNNGSSTNNNSNNNVGLASRLQKPSENSSILPNQNMENNYVVSNQLPIPALNTGAARSSRHPTLPFASPLNTINNSQAASPGKMAGAIAGIADPLLNNNLVQNGEAGIVGLGSVAAGGTPPTWISSDVIGKSNADVGLLSASHYAFNGGPRGRKSGVVEKVVERRQRRMIKNRESAARSRARKQAYTLELEAEIAKLKEMNQELRTKQVEIMEMHKNQIMDTMNQQGGNKKPCLRRSLTGPW